MPETREHLQSRIEDAIANGTERELMPGLKPTVERVLLAVEDQEAAVAMADRELERDRLARVERLVELTLRARLLSLAPNSELRAEIEAELGVEPLDVEVDLAGA